ncbi:NACHT, LRR and PYD domains-containing protein 3-like, partial [Diadema antillarum]|uniref:NACHT, LRR and PYD domains-containing protein 3-like n=1 Tax=Diadema antillarum TaxID=105358 RepID=UPI003A835E1C
MSYQRMYSTVRISPLHPESSMSLDNIYTNLAMFSKGMKDEKTDMKYGDFMKHLENICANKESKNRIVLFGEAGVGKTTFLAKLTLDWALGKCLEAIDLLFLIPLREIEENTSFGDIIMGKISDEVEFDGPRVEEHIRKNQRKVLILCDGLDEYSKDMEEDALKDDVIAVLRGNKYKCSPVVVTTRPWRAKEIESNTELEERYKFVEIEGFKEKDVNSYIAKFFPDNKEAKDGLIRLMTDKDSLVAENMAPYPIFCSMLCFIWQNEGSRSVIQGLETFAQLFEELIQHLNDHYAGKEKSQKKKAEKSKQGRDSLQQFGKDALYCLLKNKLVFGEEDLTTRPNDLKTVCEIGVLTREERLVRRRENNRRRTEIVVEYQIPHKLFLEFLAGVHLAWLYGSNREEFNRINSVVMEEYESFEYLLYFTVAQNKEVGRNVIASLCQTYDPDITQYDDDDDDDFLVDV